MKVPKGWNTSFLLKERTLIISFADPRVAVSSAVLGGGIRKTQVVINHQVSEYKEIGKMGNEHQRLYDDPPRYLTQLIKRLTGKRRGIGLMTAVDLRHLLLKRVQSGPLWVEGFFTVGFTNAVCVGEPVKVCSQHNQDYSVGTINMVLVTNAALEPSALVGAIGVATEGKTAAMLEHQIQSCSGRRVATGTGTDSIVIVTGDGPKLLYSGTHTKIGELIGSVVRAGVGTGLRLIKRSNLEVSESAMINQ